MTRCTRTNDSETQTIQLFRSITEFYTILLERGRNRVKLHEVQSAWKEQKRGCPQGSSCGPLLWNLFQNDLSLHRQSANLFMYADDHQIYIGDNEILKATQTLRRQIEAVSQWYKENLLQANPQKY